MATPKTVPFDEKNFSYQEFSEEKLTELANNLGFTEDYRFGHELIKFFISLINPAFFYFDGYPGENRMVFRGLPITLYKPFFLLTNYYLTEIYQQDLLKNHQLFQIAPQWYLDLIKKTADVTMVDNYVNWILTNLDSKKDSVDKIVHYDWLVTTYPWIKEERRKSWYAINRIRNKKAQIQIDGIQNQGDLIFLYFYALMLEHFGETPMELSTNFIAGNIGDLMINDINTPGQLSQLLAMP